jgi:hypothetical protein
VSERKLPEIKSDFALLDVKRGRRVLFKALGFTGRRKDTEPIPVTITGRIIGAWGKDDGTSQEFEIEVATVEVHPREGAER